MKRKDRFLLAVACGLSLLSYNVWKGNSLCAERFEADKQTGVYSLSSDVIEDGMEGR